MNSIHEHDRNALTCSIDRSEMTRSCGHREPSTTRVARRLLNAFLPGERAQIQGWWCLIRIGEIHLKSSLVLLLANLRANKCDPRAFHQLRSNCSQNATILHANWLKEDRCCDDSGRVIHTLEMNRVRWDIVSLNDDRIVCLFQDKVKEINRLCRGPE